MILSSDAAQCQRHDFVQQSTNVQGRRIQKIPQNLFIKYCVFILTYLNFSYLQSTLHLMQYTHQDVFSTAHSSFWTHQCWCLLVLLPFFVLPLPHQQNISLWGLFSSKQTKKVAGGKIEWIEKVGHWGHAIFGQKLLNTQSNVGSCTCTSAIGKWENTLKESSEKFTEAKHSLSQQCQLYTDTDGFLEHPPSGRNLYYKAPALQKIILLFYWSTLVSVLSMLR